MQEWIKQEHIAGVENAGVSASEVTTIWRYTNVYIIIIIIIIKSYGTPNRDYFERILSYLNLVS